MTNQVHFTKLREYAISSIEELVPGEKIIMVYPNMVVSGTKTYYTKDGMALIEETYSGTTVQSSFHHAIYTCRGYSDNVSDSYSLLSENEAFSYLPQSPRIEIKNDQTSSYSAFNLIEAPNQLSIHTHNFIVRAKDVENLDVDWTIPAPTPYYSGARYLSFMKNNNSQKYPLFYEDLYSDDIDFGEMR